MDIGVLKSPKTVQKFYENKSPRDPLFENSEKQQFDKLFKQLRLEAETELLKTITKVETSKNPPKDDENSKFNKKSNVKRERRSPVERTTSPATLNKKSRSKSPPIQMENKLIGTSNFEEEDISKFPLDFLLNIHSNNAIDILLNALFVNQIHNVNNSPFFLKVPENLKSLTNRILETFKISSDDLNKFTNEKDKYFYVMKCMKKTVKELLRNCFTRINNREKKENTMNPNQNEISEKRDQFDWLKIDSKYKFLKNKLKSLIIEKINNFEIHMMSLKNMDEKKIRKTMTESVGNLMNQDYKNENKHSFKIFENFAIHGYKNADYAKLNEQLERELNEENQIIEDFRLGKRTDLKIKPKENLEIPKNISDYLLFEKSGGSLSGHYILEDQKNKVLDQLKFLRWDKEKEKSYKETSKDMRLKYHYELGNSPCYNMGFFSFYRATDMQEKEKNYRLSKLMKFNDREWLSPEEIKFLIDTSQLLNSCIDKRKVQKIVNTVDKNIFNELELYISESIIRHYKDIKELLSKTRLEYFKEIRDKIQSKISVWEEKKSKENQLKKNKEDFFRHKRIFEAVYDKLERKGFSRIPRHTENIGVKKVVVTKMADQFLSSDDQLSKMKQKEKSYRSLYHSLRNRAGSPTNTMMNEQCNLKVRNYHPNSKIILTQRLNDFLVETENRNSNKSRIFKQDLKIIEAKYRLMLKGQTDLKNPENFQKFYSGGPPGSKNQPLLAWRDKDYLTNIPSSAFKKIVYIQKIARGYIIRKRMKEKEEEFRYDFQKNHTKVKKMKNKTKNLKLLVRSPNDTMDVQNFASPPNKQKSARSASPPPLKSPTKVNETFDLHRTRITNEYDGVDGIEDTKNSKVLFESAKKNLFFLVSSQNFNRREVNQKDIAGNTPLYYACKNNNVQFASWLIKLGAAVNTKCFKGNTALHLAMKTNNLELILYLLDNGANLNIINDNGEYPIALANQETLKKLDLTNAVATVADISKRNTNIDHHKQLFRDEKKMEPFEENKFIIDYDFSNFKL